MNKLIKIAILGMLVANFNIIRCSESKVVAPKIFDNGRKITECDTKEQTYRTKGAILARLIAREKAANPAAAEFGYKFNYANLEKEYLIDLKQLKRGGQTVTTKDGSTGYLTPLINYCITPLDKAERTWNFLNKRTPSLPVENYKKTFDQEYTDNLTSHLDIYYSQVKPARVIKPATSWNRLIAWMYGTK